jgi:hypothetical protein
MRASLRSTSSFPGINGSFGSYYRYPEDEGGKEDRKHKSEVNTFPENNNRGRNPDDVHRMMFHYNNLKISTY